MNHDEVPETCACGSRVVLWGHNTASKVRFQCSKKCKLENSYNKVPKIMVPFLKTNVETTEEEDEHEVQGGVKDWLWDSKIRIIWGMCINTGSKKQQSANRTVLQSDVDRDVSDVYAARLNERCGLERHKVGEVVNAFKLAIARARYWEFYFNKLKGSIEADETHSSTNHKAKC